MSETEDPRAFERPCRPGFDDARDRSGRSVERRRVRKRLPAISGLLLVACWLPMAVAIPLLPDLGSASEIERFWQENLGLMQAVIAAASVGFFFLFFFLGGLVDEIGALNRALGWTVLASSLLFMTALNVALGLDIAAGLLLDPAAAETAHALHSAAFLLAAPAAPAGVAFFAAVALASFRDHVFPPAFGCLALAGVLANLGALGGLFSLTGPLNSGNGLIGGIAAPIGLFAIWIATVSVWWLRSRPSPSPGA